MTYIASRVLQVLSLDKIPDDWEEVNNFSEGLAAVRVNGKEGYINAFAEWEIEPQYDYASPFRSGFACVCVCESEMDEVGSWGIIDRKGELLSGRYYDEVTSLKDGKAWVWGDRKIGFLEQNGKLTWVRPADIMPDGYLKAHHQGLSTSTIENL